MILGMTNLLRDYLGNNTHQVNTSNAVVVEYNFDAWGRRRSAADWSYTLDANDLDLVADRGFTGHEFLKWFNVYNMNGRLYDPLVGRFMNVDPYIQSPGYTQSFNRYSYCLNNPLRYTDPSGYLMAAAGEYQNLGKANTYWADNHIPVWFGMDNTNGGADGGRNGYTDDFWNNILNQGEYFLNNSYLGDEKQIAKRSHNKDGVEGIWVLTVTTTGNYHDWLRGSNSSSFQANVINTFTADKLANGEDKNEPLSPIEIGFKINDAVDKAGTLTSANLYGAQRLAGIAAKDVTRLTAMKIIGRVTGITSMVDNYRISLTEHNLWKGIEATGQLGFMLFGGEELELIYNLTTLTIDLTIDAINANKNSKR